MTFTFLVTIVTVGANTSLLAFPNTYTPRQHNSEEHPGRRSTGSVINLKSGRSAARTLSGEAAIVVPHSRMSVGTGGDASL